ncbi:hypothetical protein K0651_04100 [Ornithinimicrobium sp. Arc0846-15]|nr:hypothetical protein [Ornithinimicrobium laminariae]
MSTQNKVIKGLMYGAGAGVIASLAMAMFAMVASFAKGTGFFTPLYHIASALAPGDAMMSSMMSAEAGESFTIVVGTGLVGAAIHMMTGAMYGAVFGVLASMLNLKTSLLAVAGVVYGGLVFALSAFVALPIVGGVLGAGDPISNMAEMAGFGVFAGEHLLFGLVLGILVGLAKSKAPSEAASDNSVEATSHIG